MATKAEDDVEDIKQQFAILKADMNKLVSTIGGTAAAKKDRTVAEISEEVERLTALAKKQAEKQYDSAEKAITGNPFQSVMLALGLGFLVGALMRR